MKMKRMIFIAALGILAGCASVQPWHGFLNKDYRPWLEYLDHAVDIDVADKPLADILVEPLFPNFNCIINLTEHPDAPLRVTMRAKGITRREALWRMAQQCNVRMTAEGNVVLIVPKEGIAEPPAGGYRR
jgi:hypothetical protein